MARDWEPHVSRNGRMIQETIEIPNRIHTLKVWPVKAARGQSVVVLGHDKGLTIIFRRDTAINSQDDLAADSDNEAYEFVDRHGVQTSHYDIYMPKVTEIVLPPLPAEFLLGSSKTAPPHLAKNLIFAATCADCKVRIIKFSMSITANAKDKDVYVIAEVDALFMPSCLALTWFMNPDHKTENDYHFELLAAFTCEPSRDKLKVVRLPLEFSSGIVSVCNDFFIQKPAFRLEFMSTQPHQVLTAEILICHTGGILSILDVYARCFTTLFEKPWSKTFLVPFASTKGESYEISPGLHERKRIIDAKWVCGGQGVFVLLADGQWGIWDVQAADPYHERSDANTFVIYGFLGPDDLVEKDVVLSGPKQPRGSRSSLAPMTPNTRAKASQTFFHGKNPLALRQPPARGGISVSTFPTESGQGTEDSALIWYKDGIYAIPTIQRFWSRVTKEMKDKHGTEVHKTTGGALYGPGLPRLESPNLFGQKLTAASVLPNERNIGSFLTESQLDMIVAAEHRFAFFRTEPSKVEQANSRFNLGMRTSDRSAENTPTKKVTFGDVL